MTISHLLSVHSVQEQVREIVVVCVFCSINGRTRWRSRWMRLIQHNLVLLWLGRGSAANYWACKERNKYTNIPIENTIYQYTIPSTLNCNGGAANYWTGKERNKQTFITHHQQIVKSTYCQSNWTDRSWCIWFVLKTEIRQIDKHSPAGDFIAWSTRRFLTCGNYWK